MDNGWEEDNDWWMIQDQERQQQEEAKADYEGECERWTE